MEYPEIERIALAVLEAHGCHTAILYGSWARGDATSQSDVDVVCVREGGGPIQDARLVDGVYLDAFIYPETAFATIDPALLRLLGGIVLRERDGFGTALLAQVRAFHDRGPTPMRDDERRALVVWARKMLDRIRGLNDLEASYRRMFLLVRALEDYFGLRNAWFRGSKEAFRWLEEHDEPAHAAFARASEPGARDEAFAELVRTVYCPHDADSP